MYFGGISLINTPAADFYLALALQEAPRRVIMADPNIRANFVTDEAGYRARLEHLIACVDILKVSDEDLDWLVPGPMPQIDKANVLRGQGAKVVVLTRGAEGACALFGNDQMVEVPVPKVVVADTVGAGDTFNAGFLASLSRDGLLHKDSIAALDAGAVKRALGLGAKVAAITVSRPGANPPWQSELT